jgi:hypothetical protein
VRTNKLPVGRTIYEYLNKRRIVDVVALSGWQARPSPIDEYLDGSPPENTISRNCMRLIRQYVKLRCARQPEAACELHRDGRSSRKGLGATPRLEPVLSHMGAWVNGAEGEPKDACTKEPTGSRSVVL